MYFTQRMRVLSIHAHMMHVRTKRIQAVLYARDIDEMRLFNMWLQSMYSLCNYFEWRRRGLCWNGVTFYQPDSQFPFWFIFNTSYRFLNTVPVGLADLPNEITRAQKSWAANHFTDIVSYKTYPRGGHFAALEVPELLVEDIRQFVEKVEIRLSNKTS